MLRVDDLPMGLRPWSTYHDWVAIGGSRRIADGVTLPALPRWRPGGTSNHDADEGEN